MPAILLVCLCIPVVMSDGGYSDDFDRYSDDFEAADEAHEAAQVVPAAATASTTAAHIAIPKHALTSLAATLPLLPRRSDATAVRRIQRAKVQCRGAVCQAG